MEKDKRVTEYRKVFKDFGAIEEAEPSHSPNQEAFRRFKAARY